MQSSRVLLKTNRKKEAFFSTAFTVVDVPSNAKGRSTRRRKAKEKKTKQSTWSNSSAVSSATTSKEQTPSTNSAAFKITKILQRPKKSASPDHPINTAVHSVHRHHANYDDEAVHAQQAVASAATTSAHSLAEIRATKASKPTAANTIRPPAGMSAKSATPPMLALKRPPILQTNQKQTALITTPLTPPLSHVLSQNQKGLTPRNHRHDSKVRKTATAKHTFCAEEVKQKIAFMTMLDEMDTDGIFNEIVHKTRDYTFPCDATLFSSYVWDPSIEHNEDSWQPDRLRAMQRKFGRIVVNPHSKRIHPAQILHRV